MTSKPSLGITKKVTWVTFAIAFVTATLAAFPILWFVWLYRIDHWYRLHPEATDGQIRFQALVDGIEVSLFSWFAIVVLIPIAKWFYLTKKLKTEMDTPMPPTAPNDIVEDFTTQDQDGNTVSLSDYAKTPVVLFFYPRADTPGCTVEACSFRDAIDDLKAAGVTVLGISRDTVKAQKKFADKFSLKYPLLADPDEKICDYFGVIKPKSMYGKLVKGVERTTYLIAPADAEGKQRIAHVWSKVKPEGHAEEVLAYIKAQK